MDIHIEEHAVPISLVTINGKMKTSFVVTRVEGDRAYLKISDKYGTEFVAEVGDTVSVETPFSFSNF